MKKVSDTTMKDFNIHTVIYLLTSSSPTTHKLNIRPNIKIDREMLSGKCQWDEENI